MGLVVLTCFVMYGCCDNSVSVLVICVLVFTEFILFVLCFCSFIYVYFILICLSVLVQGLLPPDENSIAVSK